MKDIDTELDKLNCFHGIWVEALAEFAANHPLQVVPFEKERIRKILERMFDAEIDYLERNPDDYFEIYGDE